MPTFTIESTYRIPIYRQRSYEADTLAEACRLAIEDDDWEGQKEDYESAGETYVTGVWPGDVTPYSVAALPIPSHFGESLQRKAEHFEVLLGEDLVEVVLVDVDRLAILERRRIRPEGVVAEHEELERELDLFLGVPRRWLVRDVHAFFRRDRSFFRHR